MWPHDSVGSLVHPSLHRLLADLRASSIPSLKILNKADLADPRATARWVEHLEAVPGVRAIPVRKDQGVKHAKSLLRAAVDLVNASDVKGSSVQAMIVGVPNVGKSTLINTLAGRKRTRTGNAPNVTRGQQLVRVSEMITLLDTPGFLWPRLDPVECGYRLATTGAISDRVVEFENLARFSAEYMLKSYPELLAKRYGSARAHLHTRARARSCAHNLVLKVTQRFRSHRPYRKAF